MNPCKFCQELPEGWECDVCGTKNVRCGDYCPGRTLVQCDLRAGHSGSHRGQGRRWEIMDEDGNLAATVHLEMCQSVHLTALRNGGAICCGLRVSHSGLHRNGGTRWADNECQRQIDGDEELFCTLPEYHTGRCMANLDFEMGSICNANMPRLPGEDGEPVHCILSRGHSGFHVNGGNSWQVHDDLSSSRFGTLERVEILPCGNSLLGSTRNDALVCILAAGHAGHHQNEDGLNWVNQTLPHPTIRPPQPDRTHSAGDMAQEIEGEIMEHLGSYLDNAVEPCNHQGHRGLLCDRPTGHRGFHRSGNNGVWRDFARSNPACESRNPIVGLITCGLPPNHAGQHRMGNSTWSNHAPGRR